MDFTLDKECLNIFYENKIAIEFETIKDLSKLSKEIKKLNFYCSQSINNFKLLLIFKSYKEYCICRSITNFTGKENINAKVTYIKE